MFDPRYVRLWPHVLRLELCGFASGNPHVFWFQALVLDVMQHMFASGRVCCVQTSMSWPLAMFVLSLKSLVSESHTAHVRLWPHVLVQISMSLILATVVLFLEPLIFRSHSTHVRLWPHVLRADSHEFASGYAHVLFSTSCIWISYVTRSPLAACEVIDSFFAFF